MNRKRILASWILLLMIGGSSAGADSPIMVHRGFEGEIMGTPISIGVYGPDPAQLEEAVRAATDEMRRIDVLMTTWKPSPLTRLNDSAGQGPIVVPLELAQILSRGVELYHLTDGAFDISFYSAGRLWNFKAKPPALPDPEILKEALKHVDAGRIRILPDLPGVDLPEGMAVDLGGYAKGYAVDRAMDVLMRHGVEHAVVNAGGDLKVLGLKDGTSLWEIALKHPRDRERAMAVLKVSNTCVITSGDYERFFVLDGRRYHHILDPRTGYPATGCLSATVVAFNAEFADALATACCVLGPEKGLELIARLPGVEALLVDMEGNVHASDGLRSSLIED